MLNNFLRACNTDTVEPYKKQMEEASERTRASLLLWLVLTLSDLETRAISGRPLKIVAPSRRNQISVNDKKTENISRYWPNPPETHLAGKQGVRYYQSWETWQRLSVSRTHSHSTGLKWRDSTLFNMGVVLYYPGQEAWGCKWKINR